MKRQKRQYTLGIRGERAARTRQRIAEAAMELHEELGPRRTTISAVAARAGVERLTVYRHFPDEEALFAGCAGRFRELHPAPDPVSWRKLPAKRRARKILSCLYGYYGRVSGMLEMLYRDVGEIPALEKQMRAFEDYLALVAGDLAEAAGGAGRGRRAVAGLLTRFSTWTSLEREGLGPKAKIDLALTLLSSAASRAGAKERVRQG